MKASCFRYLKIELGLFRDRRLLCWTRLNFDQLDLDESFAKILSEALVDPSVR